VPGIRVSTYEFWRDTIQTLTYETLDISECGLLYIFKSNLLRERRKQLKNLALMYDLNSVLCHSNNAAFKYCECIFLNCRLPWIKKANTMFDVWIIDIFLF